MPEQMVGFPFWEVTFEENGRPARQSEIDALLGEVPAQGLTDLFIFSHGWNNSRSAARSLYERFFGEVRPLLDTPPIPHRRAATVGTIGVIWPSMRWPDEAPPAAREGGAASINTPPSDAELVLELKAVFRGADEQRLLHQLARLLDERPKDRRALARFHQLMGRLTTGPDAAAAGEDNGEVALLTNDPEQVFTRFATVAPRHRRPGGAAGLGDVFGQLWSGAKEALRAATYWEMKKRAGIVGKEGLGPLIGRLHRAQPNLRVHLLGHSFGARAVSFALAGLPDGASEAASPVKSIVLFQGAFSHFAFAEALPHDRSRAGALAGMARRVDGPLLASHSLLDTAVGKAYPLASIVSRDDAAADDDLLFQWGAIGHDGAQAVNATELRFGPVGQSYPFAAGRFSNLDGNGLIKEGGPPAGAHGDIFHPEIAWATLVAAGIAAAT